jgi:hypothetical protein
MPVDRQLSSKTTFVMGIILIRGGLRYSVFKKLVIMHLFLYFHEAVAKGTLQTPSPTTNPSSLNPINPSTVLDSPSAISTSESSFLLNAEKVSEEGVVLGKEIVSSLYMY